MLHYKTYEHPGSDEWVTFIHGAGGSSAIWFRQLRDFKKEFNVLMIDLRGHGLSKLKLDLETYKKYTFEFLANDIVEVIDHLQIKTSHFVGISLGTIIIRKLADMRPDLVSSLIMGGAIVRLNTRSQFLMRVGVALKSVLPYMILYRLFAFIILPRRKHRESRHLFIEEAKKLYQKEFIRWFRLASKVNPLLKLFRSVDIGIPTLYVMGDEDYMFLPAVEYVTERHASAQLVVIPECGHVVNVEKPQIFNSRVIEWLSTIR